MERERWDSGRNLDDTGEGRGEVWKARAEYVVDKRHREYPAVRKHARRPQRDLVMELQPFQRLARQPRRRSPCAGIAAAAANTRQPGSRDVTDLAVGAKRGALADGSARVPHSAWRTLVAQRRERLQTARRVRGRHAQAAQLGPHHAVDARPQVRPRARCQRRVGAERGVPTLDHHRRPLAVAHLTRSAGRPNTISDPLFPPARAVRNPSGPGLVWRRREPGDPVAVRSRNRHKPAVISTVRSRGRGRTATDEASIVAASTSTPSPAADMSRAAMLTTDPIAHSSRRPLSPTNLRRPGWARRVGARDWTAAPFRWPGPHRGF